MSIGNVKTSGSKGTNYPWQYAMLKTLTAISTSLGAGTEFESRLVRLIAGPYTLYLEVRIWDIDSSAWSGAPTYYEVGSNVVVVPPSPVEYADEDNALVLTTISTAVTAATNTATILRSPTSGLITLSAPLIKSISFYNGSAVNANVKGVILKPGETVNFDAGGNANAFPTSTFTYDPDPGAADAGDLLIIYVV